MHVTPLRCSAQTISLLVDTPASRLRRAVARLQVDYLAIVLARVVLAAAYGCTLAPSLTWANDGADGDDLISAAAALGVAHPTGYPIYLLVLRLFLLLPVCDLAFRANLYSTARRHSCSRVRL